MSIEIESAELARITANALSFMPARSRVPVALIEFASGFVKVTASDTYTIGTDYAHYFGSEVGPFRVIVSRDSLTALDKQARADKKGFGRIHLGEGGMTFKPQDDEKSEMVILQDMTLDESILITVDATTTATPAAFFDLCADLMIRLNHRAGEAWPRVICFDPSLLTRFNKIRVPSGVEPVADFLCQGSAAPVLVKIGPSFIGAIMPINRDVAESNENIGQEGLWNED